MPIDKAILWLEARKERAQGEFALVLSPGAERAGTRLDAEKVLELLMEALAPSEAARLAAKITGVPKNELYRKALKS